VREFIRHDAVPGRQNAGGDGKMVGESERWKNGLQGFRHQPPFANPVNGRSAVAIGEIPAKSVYGHQYQVGFIGLFRRIGSSGRFTFRKSDGADILRDKWLPLPNVFLPPGNILQAKSG
jgi:hypothetical protein